MSQEEKKKTKTKATKGVKDETSQDEQPSPDKTKSKKTATGEHSSPNQPIDKNNVNDEKPLPDQKSSKKKGEDNKSSPDKKIADKKEGEERKEGDFHLNPDAPYFALKKELINKILSTNDEAVLKEVRTGLYKGEHGKRTEDQIKSYLEKEHKNCEILKRDRAASEKKSFVYYGRTIKPILEDFFFEHAGVRYEIEFDDNFHSGPQYDPGQELIREFEYFKEDPLQKPIVLIRFGFTQKKPHEDVNLFIAKNAEVLAYLIGDIKKGGAFGKKIQERLIQPYEVDSPNPEDDQDEEDSLTEKEQKKKKEYKGKHLVCFFGYNPENKHLKAHTILAIKSQPFYYEQAKIPNRITNKSRQIRLTIFPYNIDLINESYEAALAQRLKYKPLKK